MKCGARAAFKCLQEHSVVLFCYAYGQNLYQFVQKQQNLTLQSLMELTESHRQTFCLFWQRLQIWHHAINTPIDWNSQVKQLSIINGLIPSWTNYHSPKKINSSSMSVLVWNDKNVINKFWLGEDGVLLWTKSVNVWEITTLFCSWQSWKFHCMPHNTTVTQYNEISPFEQFLISKRSDQNPGTKWKVQNSQNGPKLATKFKIADFLLKGAPHSKRDTHF